MYKVDTYFYESVDKYAKEEYTNTVVKIEYRGVEQLAARRAHNPKVGGSNPPPATMKLQVGSIKAPDLFLCLGVSASLVLWVPRGGQSDRCLRVS